ncbi:hypothetical protein Dacet_0949 [Denitrovibrio acetiphilus DSM 12809]|uniref:NosL family protein n=1 Tax=Denitrovibrio acetiphilus (strain DSM 12809 / NBRC 114555 / N2460) TaxID=522772 RepID=D4H681_DENA2|nr:twin-arginine translocation signal domain-containing protein [Denitrovibrio acetiphilus]ADD67727.1 hypothetical protein Dacet_0949 [Denitrovibrio acetiphilus DSM 12809]
MLSRRKFIQTTTVAATAMSLGIIGCGNSEPKPCKINYDRDACKRCLMLLSDPRFCAQVAHKTNGTHEVFEDMGCAVIWLDETKGWDDYVMFVPNINNPEKEWIKADDAVFADGYLTPMSYGIAAHKEKSTVDPENNILTKEEAFAVIRKIDSKRVAAGQHYSAEQHTEQKAEDGVKLRKIDTGKDVCKKCNMKIEVPAFAALTLNKHNKTQEVFDDLGCAVVWLDTVNGWDDHMIYVPDLDTLKWLSLDEAVLAKGYVSPMNYGIGAHRDRSFVESGKTIINKDEAIEFIREVYKKKMASKKNKGSKK